MAEHPAPDRAAGPEAKPLRLFLAADMPRDHEREIDRTVAPWRERYPEGRWEAPEKWHVTLKFLGPTQRRLLPEVESAARQAAAAVEPFQLELGHLGIFPGPRRARVLWVALDDPAEGLRRLAEGLEKRLGGEFPAEKRGFNAHLTVARFRQPVRVEEPEALAASRVGGDPFVVDHILLYRSHLLGPKGSRYEVVSTYPLGHG